MDSGGCISMALLFWGSWVEKFGKLCTTSPYVCRCVAIPHKEASATTGLSCIMQRFSNFHWKSHAIVLTTLSSLHNSLKRPLCLHCFSFWDLASMMAWFSHCCGTERKCQVETGTKPWWMRQWFSISVLPHPWPSWEWHRLYTHKCTSKLSYLFIAYGYRNCNLCHSAIRLHCCDWWKQTLVD